MIKLLANLGDVNFIEYEGFLVLDTEYGPRADLIREPMNEENEDPDSSWMVYSFDLDQVKEVDGYLVPMAYDPTWPHALPAYNEWYARHLKGVASFIGSTEKQLRADLCSSNVLDRAYVYQAMVDYYGAENFDSYPIELTFEEIKNRYKNVEGLK